MSKEDMCYIYRDISWEADIIMSGGHLLFTPFHSKEDVTDWIRIEYPRLEPSSISDFIASKYGLV